MSLGDAGNAWAGVSLMEKLSELEDPRQRSNGTRHDGEILVIAVCAMLSDADSFEDIALWGRSRPTGCAKPCSRTASLPRTRFLRVFRVLDLKQFEAGVPTLVRAGSSAHLMACSPTASATPFMADGGRPTGAHGQRLRPSLDWYSARRKSPARATRSPSPSCSRPCTSRACS